MINLDLEVRRLNAIGEPLLYRIDVATLISHHGRETVRAAFIREAERIGVVSIARAPRWREPRSRPVLKAV
jgi:transcription-repair coupling factor (superfamily II helicase)